MAKGPLFAQLRRVHEVAQVVLVHGGGDGHVGDAAQVAQVEYPVVRHPVFTHQSGPVDAEGDGQFLYSHVVYHLVECALQEGGVDAAEGLQPLFGQSGGEGDGMLFGDAHIERPLGKALHHETRRAACGHGRCDDGNLVVLLGQLDQRVAEYVLKLGGLVALGLAFALARSGVETAGSVPDGRLFFGRSIPLALDGAQVQYLRPRHILDVVQFVDDIDNVVAVDGPK